MNIKREIMTSDGIDLALARIAAEIVERHPSSDSLAIVGIRRRGIFLAQRLSNKIHAITGKKVPVGILDITLYRDDLTTVASWPVLRETQIDFNVDERPLILVDDVLYTGRTIRAALDGLIDLGRPKNVQLAVLVDRGHRELPIQADYVGKFEQTADDEIVEVRLRELDSEERVVVVQKGRS